MTNNFDKTFIRDPSPSYSEEVLSDNGMSSTLPNEGDEIEENNFLTHKLPIYSHSNPSPLQTVLHGRNTFAFWTLVLLLFIITVGNLLLSITIFGVLRLGKGMQSIEFLRGEDQVKFYGYIDLDRIYNKCGGQIEGWTNEPVTITGDDSTVTIKINRNGLLHSKMWMNETGINFKGVNNFELKDPFDESSIFSTHRPYYNLLQGAGNVQGKLISASKMTSPIGKPLSIHSDEKIAVKGSEGINIEGQHIYSLAEDRIVFNTTLGSITLSTGDGVYLDINKILVANNEFGIRKGIGQYKICVCMPQGKLFRISIPRVHNGAKITCAHFNPKYDPCV